MASQGGPSPLPPTTIHKSERISQAEAHKFLSDYLKRAATDAALQPDSTLSPEGPVSANVGSAPNLVIHNLERVQAGLAGKFLGRDLALENQEGGVFELHSHNVGDGQSWGGESSRKKGGDDTGGWEDLQTFERKQTDLVEGGDGEEEAYGTVQGRVEDAVEVDETGMPTPKGKIDKEERKRKKKERRKAEKKAKTTDKEKESSP